MREVTAPGRWVWILAGLVTVAVLAVAGTRLIDSSLLHWRARPPGISVHATPTGLSVSVHPTPTGLSVSVHPTPTMAP